MRYVFTKPKSTDFSRIQGVFSSRSGVDRKYKCFIQFGSPFPRKMQL